MTQSRGAGVATMRGQLAVAPGALHPTARMEPGKVPVVASRSRANRVDWVGQIRASGGDGVPDFHLRGTFHG